MADPTFPWEMYMRAAENRNQNRNQMNQDMAGIGQGLGNTFGSIGSMIGEQKQKALIAQIIQLTQRQGSPQQGPSLPMEGSVQQPNLTQVPQGQPMTAGGNIGQDVQMPQPIPTQPQGQQPTSGMGGPSEDNSKLIQSLMMQANPQGMMKSMMPPNALEQSEITKNNAMAQMYGQRGQVSNQAGPAAYVNDQGDVSLEPKEGYKPVTKQQLQYVAIPKSTKARNDAMAGRNEVWNRSIDTRQIDQLVSRTGLTPKMQSQLQMNTMRALRSYIPILSRPNITYQELALGEMDLAGIMHGGVPQRDELVNTHFPGWQEKVSQIKTYATGHPQEMVPPDIQAKVKQMIGDVVKIDNQFLQANSKFSKSMLGPTIRGGMNPSQNKAINEMTGTLTPPLGEQNQSPTATGPNGQKIKWNGSAWAPL